MPSRSFLRPLLFAAPFLAALLATLPPRIARADEPIAPPTAPTPAPGPTKPAVGGAAKSAVGGAAKSAVGDAAKSAPLAGDALPDEGAARPAPLALPAPKNAPWTHLLDVGGDFALVARPVKSDAKGNPSSVRYEPATGFALHIRWPLFEHLVIEGYYLDVHMPVVLPPGALGIRDTLTSPPLETYVFGARISPTMKWGRITAWLTAGAGWGRFEFRRMTAVTSAGTSYTLRERGGSFVEIPVGAGVSWEIVKRWLSIDLVGTAAFVAGQHGEAFDLGQTVDAAGKLHDVSGLPVMEASIVQTLGLSLLL